MELAKILLGGIVGTSLMTFFSYLLGRLLKSDFLEPRLLNKLLHRSDSLSLNIKEDSMWGWAIHYLTGFLFSGTMMFYFHWSEKFPSWGTGAFLGFILGLSGAIGWLITFRVHSSPPKIDLKAFLFQLVVAHVIFGLGATWVFRVWPF